MFDRFGPIGPFCRARATNLHSFSFRALLWHRSMGSTWFRRGTLRKRSCVFRLHVPSHAPECAGAHGRAGASFATLREGWVSALKPRWPRGPALHAAQYPPGASWAAVTACCRVALDASAKWCRGWLRGWVVIVVSRHLRFENFRYLPFFFDVTALPGTYLASPLLAFARVGAGR